MCPFDRKLTHHTSDDEEETDVEQQGDEIAKGSETSRSISEETSEKVLSRRIFHNGFDVKSFPSLYEH